ncbi:MAG: metallophosphoesterase [Muribaculaceae bacterium]|nr:metallophosphoesterase [Muribaculaceae bacterium]
MKKLILTIAVFLIGIVVSSTTAMAENIKFAQITDVHLSAASEFSVNTLKSAIKDINSQPDISFVIFTGDNISNPKEENLKIFAKTVKKLKTPYYVAVGNHDVYKSGGLSKVKYYEILRQENPFYLQNKPNYKFTKKGFVFLIVDGAKEIIPGSVGYYREDTLEWLEKELERNKNKDVVIFQHFPVEYPEGVESSLKTHKTYKVENYQEILSKHHNVLAVISGHFHVNSENMKDGVYHISSPALLSMPNSYKIIDIVTTKEFSPIIYTRLREFEVKE